MSRFKTMKITKVSQRAKVRAAKRVRNNAGALISLVETPHATGRFYAEALKLMKVTALENLLEEYEENSGPAGDSPLFSNDEPEYICGIAEDMEDDLARAKRHGDGVDPYTMKQAKNEALGTIETVLDLLRDTLEDLDMADAIAGFTSIPAAPPRRKGKAGGGR